MGISSTRVSKLLASTWELEVSAREAPVKVFASPEELCHPLIDYDPFQQLCASSEELCHPLIDYDPFQQTFCLF